MSKRVKYLSLAMLATALLVALTAAADTPRRWWHPRPRPQFQVSLVDQAGRPLRTFTHDSSTFVLGEPGQAYMIRIQNLTSQRVEAVVSVDGRDAVSGEVADFVHHRGYLLRPFGSVTIDGFRQSLSRAATFRFTDPSDAYSSRMGTPENVGIIGVAFFRERPRRVIVEERPVPRAAAAPRKHAARSRDEAAGRSRGNLGTEYGESRFSPVSTVRFERATPASPSRVVTLRYDDAEGLEARGIEVFPRRHRRVFVDRPQAFPGSQMRFAPPPP